MLRTRMRVLQAGLLLLALGLVAHAVLGPLVLGVIEYHQGETLTNQRIGADAVALFVVAPVAVLAAWCVRRERVIGPVLAFLPGTFAAYVAPGYVLGSDYTGLPGNNEQFLSLHLLIFLAGIAVLLVAWEHVDRIHLQPDSVAADRFRMWLLFGAAVAMALRWLPLVLDLASGAPGDRTFADAPTSMLLQVLLDLGVVVPATAAAAFGLRTRAIWGHVAAYAVIAFYAVAPLTMAAMAITKVLNDDPRASLVAAYALSCLATLVATGAVGLYAPLRGEHLSTVPEAWMWEHHGRAES